MVLDYSKWDALELSDDSDIEVHPNVDKRSFIRAKQNQIHQQRLQRKHEIETLKYERVINDGLLQRIDKLVNALKSHETSSRDPDERVFQALIESSGDFTNDKPPPPPVGVHSNVKDQPTYSKMMGALVDQVKKEVEEGGKEDRFQAYVEGAEGHQAKVAGLQKELLLKLNDLEREEGRKITSDSIRTGFDSSSVSKAQPEPKKKESKKAETVEVLNAGSLKRDPMNRTDTGISSGAEADIEDTGIQDDDDVEEASPLAKKFAKLRIGDYKSALKFISENPAIVAEKETDGLLVEAFSAQMAGKEDYARTCVHQGLLLQYCRSLGKDGIGLFFKR